MAVNSIVQNKITKSFVSVFFLLVFCAYSSAQTPDSSKCDFVKAGKLNIYYCEKGNGPPVIFLHAGFLDMHLWSNQVTWLSKKHRVITIDLPGHGQSMGIDTTIKIAEVINRVMNQLNVVSAAMVGMSLGASCAIDFALAHPAKITSLLLCSPGLNGWQEVMKMDTLSKRLFIRADSFDGTHDPELITENFVHFWLDGPYRKTAPVDVSVRDYVKRTALEKVSKKGGSGPVFDKGKAAKKVQRITKPVLILYGDLDIPFVVNISKYLHKKIRNSQLYVVQGTAHLLSLEKPAVFDGYLKSWLK